MNELRSRRFTPVPVIRYGDNSLLQVSQIVSDHEWRHVLLVTGRRSFEASRADRILPDLDRVATVTRWNDFDTNTRADDVSTGLGLLASANPDAVVAIGGGSVLDMAKLITTLEPRSDPRTLYQAIRSNKTLERRTPGLVLVPTTSGTGSEATHFAVAYIGDDKYSVATTAMYPDAIILDPTLSISATSYQRATSGVDAIAQAIESLWAVDATPISRQAARHALRLLMPCIEPFVTNPSPVAARAMCIGSHLAGRAIDVSKTTAPHAISYAITKRYGLSHGHAVALTLGAFIERHAAAREQELRPGVGWAQHQEIMSEILAAFGASDGASARVAFANLLAGISLDSGTSGVGPTTAAERESISASVNLERLANNPVVLEQADLVGLLERAPEPPSTSRGWTNPPSTSQP